MDISAQEWLNRRRLDDRDADGHATRRESPQTQRHLPDGLSAAAIALLPDAVGVFASIYDDSGALVDFEWMLANRAAETLIGRSALVGLRLRRDGANDRCSGLFAGLAAALNGPVTRTLSASLGGGNRARWRLSATPFPDGVCATLVDLGPDSPSMAETLATALEHSAESFALFDADDRLVHATGRLKQFLPELADLLVPGASFEALVRRAAQMDGALPTDAERDLWIKARLAHHRQSDKPFTLRAQDGRWLLVSEHPAADDGVLVIYTDVTPIKRNEERLRAREAEARAARREAERAGRAKSEFLALMSHELRTPLNAVLGFSELLMSEAFGPLGNPRYRDYAADIRDSGAHLLALIDDILDLSRIESGRLPMSNEGVDLTALSAQAISMVRDKAVEGGVALRADIARDLPMLLGDPRAIRQMLLNLLTNAVKFTPSGGTAMLTATVTPDGGIGVMVADTGVGIPASDLFRIQEPFERADVTIARTADGAGLGLPIVKRLAELHGGRLELTSDVGVGTSAVLIFPASRSLPRGLCPPLPITPHGKR
jgi:two-component system, cell cycle sensor histidine kinase PleC